MRLCSTSRSQLCRRSGLSSRVRAFAVAVLVVLLAYGTAGIASAWGPCDWHPEFWGSLCSTPTPTPAAATATPVPTRTAVPTVVARTPAPIPVAPTATPLATVPVSDAPLPWYCLEPWRDLFVDKCPGIIIATPTPAVSPTSTPTPGPTVDARLYPEAVLVLVNQVRAEAGLLPVRLDDRLSRSATKYARHLSQTSCFAHECPSGYTLVERNAAEGYSEFLAMGENLAAGYATPDAVMRGWLASPGHRAAILMAEFRDMGIGYYHVEPGTPFPDYWVMELAG